MLKFVFLFSAVTLFAGPAAAENLTSRAFTEAAAAAATAAMPSAKVRIVGDLQLETRSPGGETTSTDLTNAYRMYLADPTNLDGVVRRYVSVLAETVRLSDSKEALDQSRIVPIMKPHQWVEGVRRLHEAQKTSGSVPELLTEPFNTELAIVYAEDRPRSVRYLMTRDDVGDRAKLHDLALENLGRILPKIEMRGGPDDVWQISAGGDYEASLLLVDALWSKGQIKVSGDIVVAVPGKDALFVTGSRNRAGLARLHALAADLAKGPYALTSALLVYRGSKFVVLENN
jgi:uncharacterized protein YtpQ (UPF0354 family)